jgi:hypothetical protein
MNLSTMQEIYLIELSRILPRIDQLWYKYCYMEEMVGDMPKCRAVLGAMDEMDARR